MQIELPTPRNVANQLILANSLLDQILSDPKYQDRPEELLTIRGFRNGAVKIDNAIKAIESLSKKSASS
jgi:hypothetical protein